MPATTRSSTTQTHLEDFTRRSEQQPKPATKQSAKRKAGPQTPDTDGTAVKKRRGNAKDHKTQRDGRSPPAPSGTSETESKDAIVINRAPVLELWSACVARFLHPSTPWDTCLSVGGAIATLCAVAKGRAVGQLSKPDPATAEERRRERREKAAEDGLEEIEVMGFNLRLKDGSALVGDKPKKANEAGLRNKFGDEHFQRARAAFDESLSTWKHEPQELNSRALTFYEQFRPNVAKGQRGWGRKGELSLANVRDTVMSRPD